ncbi:MAG TPA: transglycosylase SLT domain-containing protein [Trueperaceae bacterium]
MKRHLPAAALIVVALTAAWLGNALLADVTTVGGGSEPHTRSTLPNPYDSPLLAGYDTYRAALMRDDPRPLMTLALSDDSYLAYRSAMALAQWPELGPATRFRFYSRAAQLRIDDPLAREENREFRLGLGAVAEAAGFREEAIAAYEAALPHEVAVEALERLEENPYALSNYYFGARLYQEALDALGDLAAPSIEAPSYQRLGEHQRALDAYERWLELEPGNADALYGRAWSHFYLGNMERAYELFSQLSGSSSLYARALIERRQGDLDAAVSLMQRTNQASRMWLASSWLEAEGRYRDALPIYLELARAGSDYADDSAYRALTLAKRLGESDIAEQARALIPDGSFFDLRLGGAPRLPERDTLPTVELPVMELAAELARVADYEAAIGELVFALRDADSEAEAIALAETLQAYGEFRQSQRAALRYISAGSTEIRTWLVAYPRAYRSVVVEQASRQGLEPELVWAIMRQESAFYPQAVSVSNAGGLMQVVPSTWNWLAELQNEQPQDRFDPAANIRYGTYYLGWLMDYHDGDLELVVPSYNRGQGYIRRLFESEAVAGDKSDFFREIDALETREYMQRVMVNYATYRALYGEPGLFATAPGESDDEVVR